MTSREFIVTQDRRRHQHRYRHNRHRPSHSSHRHTPSWWWHRHSPDRSSDHSRDSFAEGKGEFLERKVFLIRHVANTRSSGLALREDTGTAWAGRPRCCSRRPRPRPRGPSFRKAWRGLRWLVRHSVIREVVLAQTSGSPRVWRQKTRRHSSLWIFPEKWNSVVYCWIVHFMYERDLRGKIETIINR